MSQWTPEDFGRWGDVFEIAVKSGVLHYLAKEKLISLESFPHLEVWQQSRRSVVVDHLIEELELTDDNGIQRVKDYCAHLFVQGFALGITTIRAYMQHVLDSCPSRQKDLHPKIDALWCPFSLPSRNQPEDFEVSKKREDSLEQFGRAMSLPVVIDKAWLHRGQPAQADFLMHWDCGHEHHLLCLEFSMRVVPTIPDFRQETEHIRELLGYVKSIERRGIFSNITAELSEGSFHINDRILKHLSALTTRDKPLYKLCQGASYATQWMHTLQQRGHHHTPFHARVIAVTNTGLESLYAPLGKGYEQDPHTQLMEQLGRLYREKPLDAGTEDSLHQEIRALLRQLSFALPPPLREPIQPLLQASIGEAFSLRLSEPMTGFINPVTAFPMEEALSWIHSEQEVTNILGMDAKAAIRRALCETLDSQNRLPPTASLREIHSATIRCWLHSVPKSKLNVLALEGHPGIGKTYAVRHALDVLEGGFLFFYASPRVIINDAVSRDVADLYPDALAVTTNAVVNRSAQAWYNANANRYPVDVRHVNGAVICHMPTDFCYPRSDILFLSPSDQDEMNDGLGRSSFRALQVDDSTRLIETERRMGVMKTLAQACREALKSTGSLRRIVLTGAIQGYRATKGNARTTLETFGSHFFRSVPGTTKGVRERREFAQRIPNIVVMIDELAGDAAGPMFANDFASLLVKQFLEPFAEESEGSPFRVCLILADASLGNALVMESFLRSEAQAPPKMLISEGHLNAPFRLSARPLRLGAKQELCVDALHVMADAFPATSLITDYTIQLTPVRVDTKEEDRKEARHIIRNHQQDEMYRCFVDEILRALASTPPQEQVIFFLQDKTILRDLEKIFHDPKLALPLHLTQSFPEDWRKDCVAKLDSSVHPRERQEVLQPAVRDQKRLFLMTSSGARGVSFPCATTIIAHVPGFSIESGLMEIAQLIFRGRGDSGDQLPRRLVMLIHAFVFPDLERKSDPRAWTRQIIDLVSMLILLRGSIWTRICGHAGLPQQSLSIVPVGKVGVEETSQTMSQAILEFLNEAKLFIQTERGNNVDLVMKAEQEIRRLFSDSRWEGRHNKGNGYFSVTHPEQLRIALAKVSSFAQPFVLFEQPESLPCEVSSNGILWFEDWSKDRVSEDFRFSLWQESTHKRVGTLLGCLRGIEGVGRIPPRLRQAARDLQTILDINLGNASTAQQSKMNLELSNIWAVTPVDYPRFFREPLAVAEETPPWNLEFGEHWHGFLLRASSATSSVSTFHPVIPLYRDFPHLALSLSDEPLGLRRILDQRYFMASKEFNILSSLLFREADSSF